MKGVKKNISCKQFDITQFGKKIYMSLQSPTGANIFGVAQYEKIIFGVFNF